MPTISVITPAYNAAGHIGRTIASVQSQTFNDWEHIIIDDGSSDDTPAVVAAHPDERIRFVQQSNQGPSAARNHGINLARGEYLIFLDAGDWWAKDCLEVLLNGFRERQGGDVIAHGDWALVDLFGNVGRVHSSRFARGDGPATLLLYNPFCIHAALVPTALVAGIGGFRKSGSVEDWQLWLRLALGGCRFIHVPRLVAYYHWQPDSRSKAIDQRGTIQLLDATWATISPDDPLQAIRGQSYATAYVDMCVSRFGQGDVEQALADFDTAVSCHPPTIGEIDTYYRIAYAEQAPHEGADEVLNDELDESAARTRIDQILNHLNNKYQPAQREAGRRAAFTALGLAGYHEQRHTLARACLWSVIREKPSSLQDRTVGGTFIKTLMPAGLLNDLRKWRQGAA